MLQTISTETFLREEETYDLIIDARSPAEYHHSKIPNAINLYALSDEEHHEVGYIHKQQSKNDAKLKGASYICCNAARHIYTLNKQCKIGSKIAIYCARGGLRSASLATIFSNIGYRVDRLELGYKGYRSAVVSYLDTFDQGNFIVLGGNTGCGKTQLLQHLDNAIDLEGLANHLGSTFGYIKGEQPSQKEFQNRLFWVLNRIDWNKPVFIEGESKRIGTVILPDLLYRKMGEGKRIEITAPIEQRVARILRDYEQIDDAFFYHAMDTITPYIKKIAKQQAIAYYQEKNLAKVAEILLLDYYDNVYKKPQKIDFSINNSDINVTLSKLNNILDTL
ncbi:tRNA 2-selenouridine(34) synthase MnmH [Sulfurospirillum sp. 1612]|uniref:tRNA 2-selenouridine(34) synthase MnmH n=1 Tax=Sulfurospirillum sp. 1612 TaxID=3094835 RepID=UPI002F9533AF